MNHAIQRRGLLGLLLASAAISSEPAAWAEATATTSPTAPIEALNATLLSAMKASRSSVAQRFDMLAPAVDRAFDLTAVLQNSVGSRWNTMGDDEKNRLLATFRRYTVCNYVANFNSWSGQTFRVDPTPRSVSATQVVVRSWLVRASEQPVELSYVMQQMAGGWRAVDVLADGSISRVAVQRSDFRGLLASGGVGALVSSLERKVTDLSGGALA